MHCKRRKSTIRKPFNLKTAVGRRYLDYFYANNQPDGLPEYPTKKGYSLLLLNNILLSGVVVNNAEREN